MKLDLIADYCDHIDEMQYFYDKMLEVAASLPSEYPFLEIGTRYGGSALLILHAILESGKTSRMLITVDPYGAMPYTGRIDNYHEDFRRTAMKLLSNFCFDHKLNHTHFRLTSLQFYDVWTKGIFWLNGSEIPKKFGSIYFDGDHADEVVFEEIRKFVPMICPGGFFAIDDQDKLDHYSSVTDIIPIAKSNRLFFDVKPECAR